MDSRHIAAVEKRFEWAKWAKEEGERVWAEIAANRNDYNKAYKKGSGELLNSYSEVLPAYKHVLECGDTFYMNKNFCALVEHCRDEVPDDLQFELNWITSPVGWLWIETPFLVPRPADAENLEKIDIRVSALGWIKFEDKVYFLCFQGFDQYRPGAEGFGCWSHFTIKPGDKLINRIREFEGAMRKAGWEGTYDDSRETNSLHEIRWIYAAMHLMSQRLAHHSNVTVDRHTRRRHERAGRVVPPIIRVVSLRRLEEDRHNLGQSGNVDWQWQWHVKGHWRLQPYKTIGDYKWIFIEDYIKGPENRPLKPPQHTIYRACR